MSSETNRLPISLLLQKDLPFAVFRLPRKGNTQLIVQSERVIESISFEDLDGANGFAVAEFGSYQSGNILFIKPDLKSEQGFLNEEAIQKIKALPDATNFFKENTMVSEMKYLKTANQFIQELNSGNLKKVVLSRVICADLRDNFEPGKFFQALENSYSEAFVYLINLPGKGCWAGATPEVLLQVNDTIAQTVSLAGTKPVENIDWTAKELEEQNIVTDSIAETLKNCGVNHFKQKGPETVIAGNIAHLKTIFQFPIAEIKGKMGKLVKQLHPTPAVCGLPKEIAFEFISKTEMHKRRFYTGFLGPVNQNGNTNLFVNLRCAELGKNKMNVYVGGGLTAASIADDEWIETVRKSKTLLAVAEKLQTFAQ